MVKFSDPIIYEKLIAHPDYVIPLDLPPKPSNPNALKDWRRACKDIQHQSAPKNAKLYKTIWNELNSSTPQE